MKMACSYEGFEQSDNFLVRKAREGDEGSLQLLFKRYRPTVTYLASSFSMAPCEQEDLIQEGLIALYFALRVYDFNSSSFSTFASLCVKRAMISALRKNSGKKNIPEQLLTSVEDHEISLDNDPEAFVIERENFYNFSNQIKESLSDFEYSVLTAFLKYSNYQEVCDNLGVSRKEADNALQRARKKIKKINGESC